MQQMELNKNSCRYKEIIEELSCLSDMELHSFCLKESDLKILEKILDYKYKKSEFNQESSSNLLSV